MSAHGKTEAMRKVAAMHGLQTIDAGYSIIDNRPSDLEFRSGAFSCWVCQKTFNKQLMVMGDKAAMLHEQAHMARFLEFVFSKEEIRHAFYEHARREKVMAELQSL